MKKLLITLVLFFFGINQSFALETEYQREFPDLFTGNVTYAELETCVNNDEVTNKKLCYENFSKNVGVINGDDELNYALNICENELPSLSENLSCVLRVSLAANDASVCEHSNDPETCIAAHLRDKEEAYEHIDEKFPDIFVGNEDYSNLMECVPNTDDITAKRLCYSNAFKNLLDAMETPEEEAFVMKICSPSYQSGKYTSHCYYLISINKNDSSYCNQSTDVPECMLDYYRPNWRDEAHPFLKKDLQEFKEYCAEYIDSDIKLRVSCEDQISYGEIMARDFTDVSYEHRYRHAVEFLKEKGIVGGYSDGSYKPEGQINRVELLKIIVESKFSEEEINMALAEYRSDNYTYVDYPDVGIDEWFAPYVKIATDNAIIKGYADGTFKPAQDVSFVEALKMVLKAYDINYDEDASLWYKDLVDQASNLNLIPLDTISFDQKITRSQMADLITRLLKSNSNELDSYLGSSSSVVQDFEDIQKANNQIELFNARLD